MCECGGDAEWSKMPRCRGGRRRNDINAVTWRRNVEGRLSQACSICIRFMCYKRASADGSWSLRTTALTRPNRTAGNRKHRKQKRKE